MYVVAGSIGKGIDNGMRPPGADVMQRQRAQDRARPAELSGGAGQGSDGGQYVPSRYMVLISRIDRMLGQGAVEDPAVDQLTSLLGARIATLTARGRRTLLEMPELQALGVEQLSQLPRVLAQHIHAGTEREAVMALLRSPDFAAVMRDESRTSTYGPQGMLRAS